MGEKIHRWSLAQTRSDRKERISKLKDKSVEIIQSEEQRKKRKRVKSA